MERIFSLLVFNFLLISAVVAQEIPPPPPAAAEHVEEKPGQDNGIIDFPDVECEFKGGSAAMQQFIGKNIVYPFKALESNVQGMVYLSFVVSKKGKIKDIKVERSAHPLLDKAAIDVIEKMPKWKPAEKDGKKVASRVRLPINFRLD